MGFDCHVAPYFIHSVILQMIFASYSIFDSSTPILFLCVETLLVFFLCPFFWLSVVGLDSNMCSLLSSFNTFFYIIKVCWKKVLSESNKKSATFCSELNEFWIEIQLFMMRPSFSVTVHSCANFKRFSFTFDISFMRFFFLSENYYNTTILV